jgi:methionine-rich copper-binding protein CopC
MKTFSAGFYGKSFCKAVLLAVLIGIFSTKNTIAHPSVRADNPFTISSGSVPTSDQFMASSYHIQNSFGMVVHLVNPQQKMVHVRVVDSKGKVVFRKSLGNPAVYATIYNMEKLPNDNYTLIIQSVNYTYFKAFSLHTETKRMVKVSEKDSNASKQEII